EEGTYDSNGTIDTTQLALDDGRVLCQLLPLQLALDAQLLAPERELRRPIQTGTAHDRARNRSRSLASSASVASNIGGLVRSLCEVTSTAAIAITTNRPTMAREAARRWVLRWTPPSLLTVGVRQNWC